MPNDEPRTTLNRYTRIFKQVTPRAEKYKSSLFDYASFFVRQTVYGQKRTENERFFLPVDRGCAFRAAISARKHARKRARKHARKPARKHGPQTCPQTFYTKVK